MGLLTVRRIKVVANTVILVIAIAGAGLVAQKGYTLAFAADTINIVKPDVPWCHPADDVAILLDGSALAENPHTNREIQVRVFAFDLARRAVSIILLVLILHYLKGLLVTIRSGSFFEPAGVAIIDKLGLVVLAYVASEFFFYQFIPYVIPVDLMIETMNLTSWDESLLENIVAALDFRMLFVSLCLFVISVSFRAGYDLTREAELTI